MPRPAAAPGSKPRARIKAFANIGSEPAIMLTGPVDVTKKVLKKAGMTLADIDLFEVNEAFASVVLRFLQAFDVDHAKVNVNGGAIALGHPLGATGAMILGTAIDEMERRNLDTALVTLVHRRRHGHGDHHRAGVRTRPRRTIHRPLDSNSRRTNHAEDRHRGLEGRLLTPAIRSRSARRCSGVRASGSAMPSASTSSASISPP